VILCALVAWLFDHSLLTSAGIGSLGLDVWRLLGRQVAGYGSRREVEPELIEGSDPE
jgi:hypothetical protein